MGSCPIYYFANIDASFLCVLQLRTNKTEEYTSVYQQRLHLLDRSAYIALFGWLFY